MRILGYTYTVEPVSQQLGGDMGNCTGSQLRLRIATDVPQQQIESTVLHEIIEAINFHLHLGLTNDKVCPLETGLYAALTENGVDLSPLARGLTKENV